MNNSRKQSSDKKILKNTIFLYIRMFVTVLVSLYTSRVVLNTLGFNDFGIYAVVGGFVTMFSIFTNTMTVASQRFFSFEIGVRDDDSLRKTFNTTLIIYIIFGVFFVIIGETFGLWFVLNKLNIEDTRKDAVFWVYQMSLISFIINLIRLPYNSLIIAHENMSFYSWVSIIESLLKLIIVFLLIHSFYDKLIIYSIYTTTVVLLITLVYIIYCYIKLEESHILFYFESRLFYKIIKFSSWSFLDSISNISKIQGVNMLLNIFFDPTINAARSISFQIQSQIASFAGNAQLAYGPQITKYYACKDYLKMKGLYYQSSKVSFFLLYMIALPIFLSIEILINFWLENTPPFTYLFAKLLIINLLIDAIAGTSNNVIQSSGRIKMYQIFSSLTIFLNLPLSYLFLKNNYGPDITFYISILISLFTVLVRLVIIQYQLEFSLKDYFNSVVLKIIKVVIASAIVPIILSLYLRIENTIIHLVIITIVSMIMTLLSVYFLGLSHLERQYFGSFLINRIKKK